MEHKELIEEVKQQFQTILNGSEQSIYIYLDDIHKFCNDNFSSLLGYSSPEEWSEVRESFPSAFVEEDSQRDLVKTYQNAMQKMTAAQVEITWKKKDGALIDTRVILVPIEFNNRLLALHFIETK